MEAVGWWSEWRQMGWLPWPGSIHDQPAYVYDALIVCEAEQAEIDKERSSGTR